MAIPQTPKILIIAQEIAMLEKSVEYLTKRGWSAKCVDDLRKGMEIVAKERPTHVLVSVNVRAVTSQNFITLRDDLKNKYKATLVVFGENQDVHTSRRISASEVEFKIYPPISGTMLEIKLKQILMMESAPTSEAPASTFVTGTVPASKTPAPTAKSTIATPEYQPVSANREIKKSSDARLAVSEIRSHQKPSEVEVESEPIFKNTCEPQTGSRPVEILDEVEEIAVLSLQSSSLNGYLVMARGKQNLGEIKKILKSFSDTLVEMLKKRGVTVVNVQNLEMTVNKMSFGKWTKSCAQFCYTAEHLGAETAIAFIPHPKALPNITSSPEHVGKLILSMSDIVQDLPIDCDLKVYLPKNKRFFLYLKKGSPFTQDRIDRLKESESNLFIEQWDEAAFRTYHARNVLNQTIGASGAEVN